MPPAYVKPYVKRQKNDAADAEAICEAVTRANMRFVETKTPEQQSCLMLHRTRQLFIRQQTSVINAIRAHLAELGIVAPVGRKGVEHLLAIGTDGNDQRVPEVAPGVSGRPWRAAADVEGSDPGVRPPDPGLAPLQCDEPAVGCHSRHWAGAGHRSGRQVADPKAFRSGRSFSVTHLCQCIVECGLLTGTRSAEGIMASGHVNRANRPNTWPHRLTLRREVLTCQPGAVHTWHIADVATRGDQRLL